MSKILNLTPPNPDIWIWRVTYSMATEDPRKDAIKSSMIVLAEEASEAALAAEEYFEKELRGEYGLLSLVEKIERLGSGPVLYRLKDAPAHRP